MDRLGGHYRSSSDTDLHPHCSLLYQPRCLSKIWDMAVVWGGYRRVGSDLSDGSASFVTIDIVSFIAQLDHQNMARFSAAFLLDYRNSNKCRMKVLSVPITRKKREIFDGL